MKTDDRKKSSLKQRLFLYMFLLALLLIASLTLGLFLVGSLHSRQRELRDSMNQQMIIYETMLASYYEKLDVDTLHLSTKSVRCIEKYLKDRSLKFSDLRNNQEELEGIQGELLDVLRSELLLSDGSGAFVILDTSVSSEDVDTHSGLYVMQDPYQMDEEMVLFRGIASVGKEHGIVPHRKWRLEFDVKNFPDYEELTEVLPDPDRPSARISSICTIPGTSDRAMYLSVPIRNQDGEFYGIVGFEVNSNYFKEALAQPTTLKQLTCVLVSRGAQVENRDLDLADGFSSGVRKGYYLEPTGVLKEMGTISNTFMGGRSLSSPVFQMRRYDSSVLSYVGMVRDMQLTGNSPVFTAGILMPKSVFDKAW